MRDGFSFQRTGRDGNARAGRLSTPNGVIETPAFMPVATYGAVRGVAPGELRDLGAQILLANTYHLHERPGEDVVAKLGGLHGFTGWTGPWLTDSGGFQVTSLAHRMAVEEEGVHFRSPLDGSRRLLSPESAMAVQQALGADIAMALDECRPPEPGSSGNPRVDGTAQTAMARTLRWALRCRQAHTRPQQALFGIVQGGGSLELRRESARGTAEIGFDGYAHGGLGLGEERSLRSDLVAGVHEELPEAAPRYLMGIGRPTDLLDAVTEGVDLFDCVLPTRNGRHGVLFTRAGLLHIKNARFREDPRPVEADCGCPTCSEHSRAYLSYLIRCGEVLGQRLASLHNLRFYLRLLAEARQAIARGRLAALRERVELASAEDAA